MLAETLAFTTRAASLGDVDTITHHRHRIFVDAGRADNRTLEVMDEHFRPWLTSMLREGRYIGWLAMGDGPEAPILGSAGLLILDWPPHPLDPTCCQRGYLLNVYVVPEHRRKRLGSQLMELALAEARRRQIRVVALHSTDAGRPAYRSNGFRPTNEMFYVEPIEG